MSTLMERLELGDDLVVPDDASQGRLRHVGDSVVLAVIDRMDSGRVQECLGYTGEGLIRETTALGLGT